MTEVAVLRLVTRLSKRKHINWSEGEAKTQKEIDERVAKRMLNPTFLEALMQENRAVVEHLPVGFDRQV